jgi:fumarate reductase subunit C
MPAGPGESPPRRPFYYPYPLTIAGCVFWLLFVLVLVLVILYFRPGAA